MKFDIAKTLKSSFLFKSPDVESVADVSNWSVVAAIKNA
jgi:hypothetical protein